MSLRPVANANSQPGLFFGSPDRNKQGFIPMLVQKRNAGGVRNAGVAGVPS